MPVSFKNNNGIDYNGIDLTELVKNLKIKGFPVDKSMISYYSFTNDMFVYCGLEPLPKGIYLPERDIYRSQNKHQVIFFLIRTMLY